jgi:hypothetical protein
MTIASLLRRSVDRIVGGRGEHSITVPVMDGALKPNDRLERAETVAFVEHADNVLPFGDELLCSSGLQVLAIGADRSVRASFEAEGAVTCLAADSGGALAVGVDGKGIRIRGGRHDGAMLNRVGSSALTCPTAAAFLDPDRLVVANGSARFTASQWRHDLLHRGRSGSLLLFDLASGRARTLAENLAFPSGLCAAEDEPSTLLVSEAWRHRVVRVGVEDGGTIEALAALPAYPGRIAQSRDGGYWLACFAPRSQLQEFVLREERYRRNMIAEVDPDFWIAPALSSGRSFKEPLQAGGVIRLGVHKPWAPTRSYGLVVRLDSQVQPVWSLHSRANGTRHGMTSVAETETGLLTTSKGNGEVLAFAHTALDEPDDHQPAGETR